MLSRRTRWAFAVVVAGTMLTLWSNQLAAQTVARCGKGWLERIDGYDVLHLKGTPREMGFQHGALLRDKVRSNMHNILDVKGETTLVEVAGLKVKPRHGIKLIIGIQEKYVPKKYFDELEGLAEGSGLKFADARAGNFIPELFHCSGFAIAN